ncbi:MAG: hypothetical protein IT310_04885 [Anaerolineales bacterium]|nr:hypothetical protein [Anaerolineales bacterium]
MFDINEVHAKADLIGYVERAGAKLKRVGNRYQCPCPLHGGENPNGFNVYFENGTWKWHCFTDGCGTGDAISFVEKWIYSNESDYKIRFKLACNWILEKTVEDANAMYQSAQERLVKAQEDERQARQRKEARIKELQVSEKHLYYHKNRRQWAIDEWIKAGLDEGMQEWFYLGGVDDFTYYAENKPYHSPTLTIPYLGEFNELLYIQHRLINPINKNDKYRPDVSGIDVPMFLCVPTMGFDGGLIIVMEGAKKSAVTWSRLYETDIQVIGVPTQGSYFRLTDKLKGKKPIIIPDPKGNTKNEKVLMQPYELARATGGSVLTLPDKADDYLLETDIKGDVLYRLLKQARKF